MRVTVTPKFNRNQIQAEVEREMQRFITILRLELDRVALETLTRARQKGPNDGGFNDQTGNLRSSMGYIIMYNGKQLVNDFHTYAQGSQGKAIGEKVADDIAKVHKKGWAIVMVAGMEYASWVESKGKDVITGATLGMESKIREAWERAKRLAA